MYQDFIQLREALQKKLGTHRYEHSLGVAFTSAALAMRHGCDIRQAQLAGLLHDCGKRYDNQTLLKQCEEHHVVLTDEERAVPNIIHGIYGVWEAKHHYGISDPEVLRAIRWHTTGRPEMTLLEEIVYLADYIEPGRDKAANLPEIRKLAFTDLNLAICRTMEDTVSYLNETHCCVVSMQSKALEYYQQKTGRNAL